ncbi:MAG: imidazolonepropionase [Armatimonadota bacterium]
MSVRLYGPIRELHTLAGDDAPRRREAMRETARADNAGIAVSNGRVLDVGSWRTLGRRFADAEQVSVDGELVTPGFVDPHTHLVWSGDRSDEFLRRCAGESYQQIAEAGGGIASTMRAVEHAPVAALAAETLERARLLLRLGTTTVEVKASYGSSVEACKRELDAVARMRRKAEQRVVVTFMGAHVVPPGWSRSKWIRALVDDLLPLVAAHRAKVSFQDAFCEEGAFSVAECRRVLDAGRRIGLVPKLHCDEFTALGGVEMACRLGAASCDHLLVSGRREIAALARSDTTAVVMPGTAFFLDKPYARARAMVDAGCALALGSDFNPGSAMTPSMLFAMGLAVSRMGLSAEEALCAATANAAHALRGAVPRRLGTLAPGAPADFCAWRVGSLQELVYGFTFLRPSAVFISGRRVN